MSQLRGVLLFALFALGNAFPNTISHREDACQASGIHVGHSDGVLVISWTKADETQCPDAADYRVEYSKQKSEDESPEMVGPVEPSFPGIPIYQETIGDIYCERIGVSITTLDGDGNPIAGTEEITMERNDLSNLEITDLKIESTGSSLKVNWNPIWDPSETDCKVSYKVTYTQEQVVDDPETEISIPDLSFCTSHTITVQAITNGYETTPVSETYKMNIPSVQILSSETTESGTSVKFEPLTSIPEKCGTVNYEINEKSHECFITKYSIRAVSSEGFTGDNAEETVQKPPEAVRDLTADIRSGKLQVDWSAPLGAETCDVSYEVNYEDDTQTTHGNSISLPNPPAACTEKTVSVRGVIGGVKGDVAEARVHGDVGKVTELRCEFDSGASKVVCDWKRPESTENCESLKYVVRYNDKNGDMVENEVIEESISIDIAGCFDGWVAVYGVYETDDFTVVGSLAETDVEGSNCERFIGFKNFNNFKMVYVNKNYNIGFAYL